MWSAPRISLGPRRSVAEKDFNRFAIFIYSIVLLHYFEISYSADTQALRSGFSLDSLFWSKLMEFLRPPPFVFKAKY